MEDTVKGVISLEFSFEFIWPCHINADIRLISTKSSPEVSSAFAEGDGRPQISSQQELGSAKWAADHLKWKGSSVGRLTAFPKRSFHHHKVVPQGGDEVVLVPCLIRPKPFEGFGGRWPTWQGCIKDRAPSMNEAHGING
jgi:hypothetical protein